ncbi:MAG: hypothetical protein ACYTKD_03410 [Planctomycetota bacterium]
MARSRNGLRVLARRLRPGLAPSAAVAVALVPAAIGIGWGLPSTKRFARVAGARGGEIARQIADLTREDLPRKEAGLTLRPLDPGGPDSGPRVYRRFALYSDHPDEMLVLSALSRMRPSRLELDPGTYVYGGLFVYPVGFAVRVAGWLGLATVTRDLGVYLDRPELFGRMYLIGRLCCLAWHAAALAAVFLLARGMFGDRAAYWALGGYALLPSTVAFSHVMKPHLAGAAPALFAAVALRELKGTRAMLVAGALAGAAASMTPPYGVAVFLLPAFAWSRGELPAAWKRVLAGVAAAAVVYAVLNPFAVMRPWKVLAEARFGSGHYAGPMSILGPVSFVRWLPDALSWPGALAAGAAAVWLVRRRPADAKALGVPVAVYFVTVSLFTSRSAAGPVIARFGCMMYPFLVVIAAGMMAEAVGRDRRWLAGVGALGVALLAASGPYVLAHASNARGAGTRVEAGEWMAEHVPAGAEIGFRDRLAPFQTPTVELARYSWLDLYRGPPPGARAPEWFMTAGRERPPPGYDPVKRFAPFGAWPFLGAPERMSYASPVFRVWRRAAREPEAE